MAKVLITGASGFLGSMMVQEALNRGLDTYAGIRSTSSRALLQDDRINFSILDFDNPNALRALMWKEKFDYVIQNAGITRTLLQETYDKVNCDYSVLLARLALESGYEMKKFLYVSSIESHGSADNTPKGVIDHETIPNPRTLYGQSKLRAENELQQFVDLPLIIFRPTAVFGPGERDLFAIFETIKKYRLAPVIGSDQIKYSFIYVKDLVRVTFDALLSDHKNKSYFVSDGRIHSINQFTDAIAKAYNVNPFRFKIPYLAVDILSSITAVTDKITGKKSLVNKEQVAKMKAMSWDCDIAPLVNDFGFFPEYSLEEAIFETAEWYVKQGWL